MKPSRTYIISEIGINHQGDVDLAKKLIYKSRQCGADAVKFQKRCLDSLYLNDYLSNTKKYEKHYQYLIPILKKVELPDHFYYEALELCNKLDIDLLVTPFDLKSLDFVLNMDVKQVKFSSWDLTNFEMFDMCSNYDKPLILSTGASTIEEIEFAVNYLKQIGIRFSLLHCKSSYPTDISEINLKFINKLKEYGVPVGYSGHETTAEVALAAVALGATIIEKHITLSRDMEGPDHKASMEPDEFRKMVESIRRLEPALRGDDKVISQGELLNKEAMAKSIVAKEPISKGAVITRDKITLKSPAKGLPPYMINRVIGQKSTHDVKKDEYITINSIDTNNNKRIRFFDFGRYGLVGRFSDHSLIIKHKPKVIEYHLCYDDLSGGETLFECEATPIFHAPEIVGNRLVDPSSPDLEERRFALDKLKEVIYTAYQKKGYFNENPKVIIHPCAGAINNKGTTSSFRNNFYRSFEELRRFAERYEVELLPENLPPYPWYFGGRWYTRFFMSSADLIEFARKYDNKVCLDLSHAKLFCNEHKYDFYRYIEEVKPYVGHLHISDARGVNGEGVQIGKGEIDFQKFFRLYGDYEGSWVPEIWRGHLNSFEGFRIAIDKLREEYYLSQVDCYTEEYDPVKQ